MIPAEKRDEQLTALFEVLPLVARVTSGRAGLAGDDGTVLRVVDGEGREQQEVLPGLYELVREAAVEGRPAGRNSLREIGGSAWALPVGSYILFATNSDRASRESELQSCLELALPLIAKVAGGEAVIFNREGKRLMSYLPNGRNNLEVVGRVFQSCKRTMESGRPDVSPSQSFPGAMAVRIPLTRDFGFGFNNAATVMMGKQLLEEMNRDGTARYTWEDIVGESEAIEDALRVAKMAAATNSPVWIYAESGSGKELFAQAIHNASPRRGKPFIAVNCASLPPSLIESTLFGYTTGAFTGAQKGGQEGLFERADGGTLLLDEISEMDVNLQAKLLRVLQEREVTRIGSATPVSVDVRIISTTNRDLRQMASEGSFRQDLFYRLNVVDLAVPPLRKRKQDIPILAEHFLSRLSFRIGKLVSRISTSAMGRLQAHDWPGNVRELENCIERAMNLAEGDTIRVRHLPPNIACPPKFQDRSQSLKARLREFELMLINETVSECNGNKAEAARRLGISFTTLWRKLNNEEFTGDLPAAED